MNYTIHEKHISLIKAGDTIEHNGELRTVCKSNISRTEFLGTTLFGDSYNCGHKPVKVATIHKAMP